MREHPFPIPYERDADMQAEAAAEYYCACNLEHTMEEEDSNQCDCCGKAIE